MCCGHIIYYEIITRVVGTIIISRDDDDDVYLPIHTVCKLARTFDRCRQRVSRPTVMGTACARKKTNRTCIHVYTSTHTHEKGDRRGRWPLIPVVTAVCGNDFLNLRPDGIVLFPLVFSTGERDRIVGI